MSQEDNCDASAAAGTCVCDPLVSGDNCNGKSMSSGGGSSGSGTGLLKCYICVGSICLNETTCSNSEDSCIKSFAGEREYRVGRPPHSQCFVKYF